MVGKPKQFRCVDNHLVHKGYAYVWCTPQTWLGAKRLDLWDLLTGDGGFIMRSAMYNSNKIISAHRNPGQFIVSFFRRPCWQVQGSIPIDSCGGTSGSVYKVWGYFIKEFRHSDLIYPNYSSVINKSNVIDFVQKCVHVHVLTTVLTCHMYFFLLITLIESWNNKKERKILKWPRLHFVILGGTAPGLGCGVSVDTPENHA